MTRAAGDFRGQGEVSPDWKRREGMLGNRTCAHLQELQEYNFKQDDSAKGKVDAWEQVGCLFVRKNIYKIE